MIVLADLSKKNYSNKTFEKFWEIHLRFPGEIRWNIRNEMNFWIEVASSLRDCYSKTYGEAPEDHIWIELIDRSDHRYVQLSEKQELTHYAVSTNAAGASQDLLRRWEKGDGDRNGDREYRPAGNRRSSTGWH